ncbi:MAG: DUF512 domain-containing protein [Oscillospiraceae bacterium]|nr:DUF512 domain-containing protein [Candidatus Ruminococcus equi]
MTNERWDNVSVKIKSVERHSPAEKCKIKSGDTLLSINGNEIVDVLDYRFYQFEEKLTLVILDIYGKEKKIKLKKSQYDELGLEFETYLIDKEHSCKNKCIFCFIDQLPQGLRDTLYFKDDDSRLSFLFGNYITLTNLSKHEISRIIKMHISPINVSVHTTNKELRCKMMNNRFAGESLSVLKRFAENNIEINCQIVCCPDINDGEELRSTLKDLTDMGVNMIAVVPVGLTKYRENLYPIKPFDKKKAEETLDIVEHFGEKCMEKYGHRVAFAADELYIKANREIPPYEFYEDFPALENGVGLIALLKEEVKDALFEREGSKDIKRKVSVACGVSAAPYLSELADEIHSKFENVFVNVYPIVNNFFGEQINVSGLIVGKDLINGLKDKDLGDELLISSSMLRFENDLFLDDTSVEDVEKALDIKVTPINNNGEDFVCAVLTERRE